MGAEPRSSCRACQQPCESRPLRALCVNNRSDKPKTLDRQAIFDVLFASIFASIFAAARHLLATVLGSARPAERGIFRTGEAAMAKVLNEILLFSSMAVFVTGIVLAAARLLI